MTTTILNKPQILKLLSENKLKELFTQHLGWNNFKQTMPVQVDGTTYTLNGIVEKEGFAIYELVNKGVEPIKYDLRKKISNKLAKTQLEHLIVFTEKNEQVWQWIKRATKNSPAVTRSEIYSPATQSGEKLYQKLEKLFFGWDDYTITDVTQKVNDSLNKDKVTKRFYEEFKKHKNDFSEFIEGIKETVDQEWYSSLMLNRLMFIYFIQKKGFLNNDLNYMRNKLNEIQEKRGNNKFYSFYREFLLVLFHEGFARELKKRSADTLKIIGKIPYLNGGLFDVHELERKYPDITISDKAFEKIFDFFDKYDWHLDDRPVSDDKQINPDVIGHIFEKYINQKQMGAYYTKEDITEYISKSTIIPYLFEEAKKKCEVAFKENSYIWQMLKDNPDKYIYDAVKKGCDKELPDYIAKGLKDVSKREEWNTPTAEEFALPTEIWRETVERRNRYFEIKSKLEKGGINSINDFVTYNLDIRQFAEDIIANAESPDVVKAFYYTIAGHIASKPSEKDIPAMSILDPTCGSGAFLFAGLNILEPLYDACIDKMYDFKHEKPESYKEFDGILADIEKHPNREYFIYKSIILNNLYGVDIMKEATEIAKLRLFLKLASCAEVDYKKDNFGLEALPDIDFNIRSGNSLVGFANYHEVEEAVKYEDISGQMALIFDDPMPKIDEKAQNVALAYKKFKNAQISSSTHDEILSAKHDLQDKLNELNAELNQYMAKKYGIDTEDAKKYKKWLSSHEPFNWFVEFYDVIHNRGGFDVVIGNPPYVEYNDKIKKFYTIKNYKTEECGNLYAFILELLNKLSNREASLGMIVPHSSICTDRMKSLLNSFFLDQKNKIFHLSTFCIRPAKLFDGVDQRLLIFTANAGNEQIFSSKYHHWHPEYRESLFDNIAYVPVTAYPVENSIAKIHTRLENAILEKLLKNEPLSKFIAPTTNSTYMYYHNAPRYFIRGIDFIPYFWNEKDGQKASTQLKKICFLDKGTKNIAIAVLNSSLFFWWFSLYSDCRHLNNREIYVFPVGMDKIKAPIKKEIEGLVSSLMKDYHNNAVRKECYYKATGKVIYDEYYSKKSKAIIDKIDKVLAKHYGFTDEELDYIVNYDIKYRMGDSLNEEDE